MKLKSDLNEYINLKNDYKKLENEYQNLSNKFKEKELEVNELDKKNKEQENYIKQLKTKIEVISKASEFNSDKSKFIYKKKNKNKVAFENINNNNNSINNNNYDNYYNNNNTIYYNSNCSDNNNYYYNSNNNNYNFNSNNNNNFINYNNNDIIYNNNSINNGIYSNNNLNNNYNYNFDNYINNNLAQCSKAPFVGLINVGGNKFINSILQCLSQTMALTNYFLDLNNKSNILKNQNNLQLCPLILELNENLWNNQTGSKIYKPYSFINLIQGINNNNHKIEKAKDLILFILDELDKELNQPNNSYSIQNNKFNKFDKIKAFEHFFNEFKQKISIISEIFVGFMESRKECLNCKKIYNSQNLVNPIYFYTYEIFKYLIFPLDKIKDMKNNNNISIYDCFEYNQIDKKIYENNCVNCKTNRDFNISSRIFIGQNILIIILENENNNPYVKLDIQLTINLTNYILKKDNSIYDLYGIVNYFGNNTPSPYMACCLNQKDNQWYKFNNEYINQINDIQKDFIESGAPSILFYKKQIYNSDIFNNLINN